MKRDNIILGIIVTCMIAIFVYVSYMMYDRSQPTYTYWAKGMIQTMPVEATYPKPKDMSVEALNESLIQNMEKGEIHEYEVRKNGIVIYSKKIIPRINIDENGYIN